MVTIAGEMRMKRVGTKVLICIELSLLCYKWAAGIFVPVFV
jgi:hypothetical protein